MPRLSPYLAAALLLIALPACDAQGPPLDTAEPSVFPLAVGHQWVYEVTHTDKRLEPPRQTTWLDTLAVLDHVAIDGETWYRVHHTRRSDAPLAGYYTQRPDGIYERSAPNLPAQLRYPQPADPDRAYPLESRVGAGDDLDVIVPTREAVREVPAGAFTAYQYMLRIRSLDVGFDAPLALVDGQVLNQFYFAPGVGPVELDLRFVRLAEGGQALEETGNSIAWRLVEFIPAR